MKLERLMLGFPFRSKNAAIFPPIPARVNLKTIHPERGISVR
jgi:hypothetical protein